MSETFLERLSRFTPSAGSLERDALLFAAGRRSARPNRGWITLAAALAGTQALSLALLLAHPTMPSAHQPMSGASLPSSPASSETTAKVSDGPGRWIARHRLLEPGPDDQPAGSGTFTDSEPPLRAFAPPPPSILN
jgi:hypothetical protein